MSRKLVFMIAFLGVFATSLNGQSIGLNLISTYHTGIFDGGAAEISTYDPASKKLFYVNADDKTIDILDLSTPASPSLVSQIDLAPYGKAANSVAVLDGILAAAVEDTIKQDSGRVVFFDANGTYQNQVTVGALPDMLTFTPDGSKILVANEGEPNDDYTVDPEGSVSIIDISGGIATLTNANVSFATFTSFNGTTLDPSVRIFGNNGSATVAEDVEPEYITVSEDSKWAYVVLQENNAIAIVNVDSAKVTEIAGLGFKDHNLSGNGLDPSDKNATINIGQWPVKGMYQPDAITSYKASGKTYLVTANEGDSRDYAGYSEEDRIKDVTLDTVAFPNHAFLQTDSAIGRLNITLANGDTDNDGDYDVLYAYGARSFSIWDTTGALIYDSGDEFEQRIAADYPAYFNSNNDDNTSYKKRCDNKGPEPEAVEVAWIGGKAYAFIGLERMGGIMVYDITNPNSPSFVEYELNRDFSMPEDSSAAGDLGPEDILYVSPANSPISNGLIIVSNEVSGTVSIYSVDGDTLTGVDDNAPSENALKVYPNPVNTGFINFNKTVTGFLFDVKGNRVATIRKSTMVDVSALQTGTYLLKTEENEVSKVVITH